MHLHVISNFNSLHLTPLATAHPLLLAPLTVPNLIYCYLVLQHQEQSGLLP